MRCINYSNVSAKGLPYVTQLLYPEILETKGDGDFKHMKSLIYNLVV